MKCVMAGIGLGIVVGQPEADQQRQVEPVGQGDRVLERRVEARPLRLLHPVEDVGAGPLRRAVQLPDALPLDHLPVSGLLQAVRPMGKIRISAVNAISRCPFHIPGPGRSHGCTAAFTYFKLAMRLPGV